MGLLSQYAVHPAMFVGRPGLINIRLFSVGIRPLKPRTVRGGLPIPPKTRPTTIVVFNRVLLTNPSSASWLSVGANNALADWVSLFGHRYYGVLPHKRKVGTRTQSNRNGQERVTRTYWHFVVKFSIVHFFL